MTKNILSLLLPCLFFLVFLSSCAQQKEASSAEIDIYRSGSLQLDNKKNIPKKIFVDVRDAAGAPAALPPDVEAAMEQKDFEIVDSPSEAAYILHISIVRQGEVDPAIFPSMVESGYGTPAKFSGDGGVGLIADALLVQRNIPTHKRPSRARLKNVAYRNATDSNQMRLGFILRGDLPDNSKPENFFAQKLAHEIRDALEPDVHARMDEN